MAHQDTPDPRPQGRHRQATGALTLEQLLDAHTGHDRSAAEALEAHNSQQLGDIVDDDQPDPA